MHAQSGDADNNGGCVRWLYGCAGRRLHLGIGRQPLGDYARITEVDYTARVTDEAGGEGKIVITERLTFDIHAASRDSLFWELWRDLPEAMIDGVKVGYKVNTVKQIMPGGAEVVYAESPRLYWNDDDFVNTQGGFGPGKWYHSKGPYNEDRRQYECLLFYVDGLYREKAVFEIEYEMMNAALRYGDCSELYLSMYSGDTAPYLTAFKGQILVPSGLMPAEGNYEAHTYGTSADAFPVAQSADANPGYYTFAMELNDAQLQFKPYNQYLEFTLISFGDDKHAFTQNAPVNDYYNDDVLSELRAEHAAYMAQSGNYLVAKSVVLAVCAALAALALVWALRVRRRVEKKFTFYKPALALDMYRDIPSDLDPGFAAQLVFCKHRQPKDTQNPYAAVLLDLVRKGYVELEKIRGERDWDAGNVAWW